MSQFKGMLRNDFRPEEGVNIAVKGLDEDKIILAPTGPGYDYDKELEANALKLTLTPSSGTTEERRVMVEVKNGSEKITDAKSHWDVEITGSGNPVEFELVIADVEEEEEGA